MLRPSKSTSGDASEGKLSATPNGQKLSYQLLQSLNCCPSRSTDSESCELLWRQVVPVVRHVFQLKSRTFECDYSKCSASGTWQSQTQLTVYPQFATLSFRNFVISLFFFACCMHTVCTVQ